jgi:hypothetical protein
VEYIRGGTVCCHQLCIHNFTSNPSSRYFTTMAPYLDDNENTSVQQKYGDWRDDFYDKGYVVIKGAVPKERALKYRNKMMDWLGTFPNDFDINKPETWTKENLPQSFKNGMYLNYCAAHEKYVWEARQ